MDFEIGPFTIGQDKAPFVIAEAGVHHCGSVESAKVYIAAACDAGAHAIKFQTYTADRLVTGWAELYWNDPRYKTQYDVFKEKQPLSTADYAELARFAADRGIVFLSTPFDTDSASMLNDLGMPAFKVASADITVFRSFGMSRASASRCFFQPARRCSMKWKRRSILFMNFTGRIALLHCSLAYPTP